MTESEWLASRNCHELIQFLNPKREGRKKRLFLVAVGRAIHCLLPDPVSREVFDWLELYADGDAEPDDGQRDYRSEGAAFGMERPERANYFIWKYGLDDYPTDRLQELAGWGQDLGSTDMNRILIEAAHFASYAPCDSNGYESNTEISSRCAYNYNRFLNPAFFRDIFGNPFRPVAFDPSWQTSATVSLAQSMYDSRDFATMPVLADALEETGCRQEGILDHCRQESAPHVRGCWVVDLVLGKA